MIENYCKGYRKEMRLHLLRDHYEQFHKVIDNLTAGRKGNYAIVFSSCNHEEGASTVSLNFSAALTIDLSKKVLLIDGNIRNPALHDNFGINNEKGFVELIEGGIKINEAIRDIKDPRISFIPAGRNIKDPSVLFQSDKFLDVLNELKKRFDFIIFDSSPVISYTETAILSGKVDGLIMVLEAEHKLHSVIIFTQCQDYFNLRATFMISY
ncbi:MAG: CpsD/CapB family tyrosine-protein kinase [Nitrospirae bacterium]|nr:CpsD/CapB family tyrosine-protein kinase [Nitrospirota bacterium]